MTNFIHPPRARRASLAALALVLGLIAAFGLNPTSPAVATTQTADVQVAETELTVAPAANGCSGTLVAYGHPVTYLEGALYYQSASGGTNCANANHRGAAVGQGANTSITLIKCTQTTPGSTCTRVGNAATDTGYYAYYAGPVKQTGTSGHCVASSGWIEYGPRQSIVTSPYALACG
jgi:hypothetical protein